MGEKHHPGKRRKRAKKCWNLSVVEAKLSVGALSLLVPTVLFVGVAGAEIADVAVLAASVCAARTCFITLEPFAPSMAACHSARGASMFERPPESRAAFVDLRTA